MEKKGYDILSWIWLVLLIILFTYMVYGVNSASSGLFDGHKEAIDSGNFSEMEKARENTRNLMAMNDVSGKIVQAYIIKYILYWLGAIYSIIIFVLCFKLKVGTLEKIIILIGGILTYGVVALILYFFEERKKFRSGDAQLIVSIQ